MIITTVVFSNVVLFLCHQPIDGRHFLGGSMTWKRGYSWPWSHGIEINLIQRYMWERYEGDYCNDHWNWFKSRTKIGKYGKVKCLSKKCGSYIHHIRVHDVCVADSKDDKWSAIEQWSSIYIPEDTEFELGYSGVYWSEELNEDEKYELSISTFFSAKRGSDGELNTPPQAAMPYIQHIHLNTTQTWKIPVHDPNGDIVRCRWANKNNVDECGDICGPPRNAKLNGSDCTLTYYAKRKNPVVIALIIEDFLQTSLEKRLSATSLQFLIQVHQPTSTTCYDPPRYLNSSRNESIVNGSVCSKLTEQVFFNPGCGDATIDNVQTRGPSGMTVSTPEQYQNLFIVNIEWTPTSDDEGTHFVCLRPIDNYKRYGDQKCLEYSIINNNTSKNSDNFYNNYAPKNMTPVGLVNSSQSQWTFRCGGESMKWSNRSNTYIRFYAKSSNEEVYTINVQTNHTALRVSEGSFTFDTKINWTEGEEYYIQLDRGVLTDGTKCSRLSPAMHDSSFWTFEIFSKNNKTKPPSLFFVPVCEYGSACDVFNKYCSRSNPCLNNGTCHNRNTLLYRYNCECPLNFSGVHCEIDDRPCHPNPCWNTGKCNPTSNSTFNCSCESPWEGRLCEKRINECEGITCQNRGVCQTLSNNWTCCCLAGSYGRYCEFSTTRIIIYKIVSKTFAYVAIIAMAVVAIFVVVMDVLKYGFGIDPVQGERERLRRERRAKARHYVVRRYKYVNRKDEAHVSSASFSVAVETKV
ncbi:unnamed protein product [Adineta ricciae]|uniref:EGF-like domain-containing protein n=1 Tax=Adineta ricciae TaxID=249248 RepID=A0A815NCJ1_ADIRI|nr:unnamed protein product [Adineta ricciae]CAF1469095.1 unnamed protein product [Adineta ricciae]